MEWLGPLKDLGGTVVVVLGLGYFGWRAWDRHHVSVVQPRESARTANEQAESAARAAATTRSADALERVADGIAVLKSDHDRLIEGQQGLLESQREVREAIRRPHPTSPTPAVGPSPA